MRYLWVDSKGWFCDEAVRQVDCHPAQQLARGGNRRMVRCDIGREFGHELALPHSVNVQDPDGQVWSLWESVAP